MSASFSGMQTELDLFDGATNLLARFESRLRRESRLIGLTLWTRALRRWFDAIRERDDRVYQTLMALELEVEAGADKVALLECIGRAKGLLVAAMLTLVVYVTFCDDDFAARGARRNRGRRDEMTLVDVGGALET